MAFSLLEMVMIIIILIGMHDCTKGRFATSTLFGLINHMKLHESQKHCLGHVGKLWNRYIFTACVIRGKLLLWNQ